MRSSGSGPPSSVPASAEDPETIAGIAPAASLDHGHDITSLGVVERAALERARADLLGLPYEPVRLGRFVLLGRLGAGGMGIVYAGYDDTLDRRIAIKLITPERASNEQARRRLFREAQAMAKLSHPNVVQVFEAGDDDGRLFVAMEFVEGQTLREWLRDEPRGWREIVSLFVEIGAGLAAAHVAGIVHRDFKPDNVLIGRDGRPKVADFGVAAIDLVNASVEHVEADPEADPEAEDAPVSLTRTGEVMGTPAYMSPEHCLGRPTDARSDQFSFCIALYEALYGERPFDGRSTAELMRAISRNQLRPVPEGVSVPSWLRAAIGRGLAPRPEDRYRSMDELLSVLSTDPRVRTRRFAAMAVVGTLLVGGAVMLAAADPSVPCTEGAARLAGVWDAERRDMATDALASVDLPYAADTARRVGATLDAYATRWETGYRDACEATQVRRDQSEQLMDLRMTCLARAKTELRALVEQLEHADALIVERAIRIANALPRLERCDDAEALRAEVPPPDDPALAQAVEDLRARRAEALTLHKAGKSQDARAVLEELRPQADALGYDPLRAELDQGLATVLLALGHHDEAEAALEETMKRALQTGITGVAAEAASGLSLVVGERLGRFDEARWLGSVALALANRYGDPEVLASVHTHAGGILVAQGKFAEAEVELRHALDLLVATHGPDDLGVAKGYENLGIVLTPQYAFDEAEALARRAQALRLHALGPDHPEVARSHANLGNVLSERGRQVESEHEHRRARELFERAYGPDHPDVAMSWTNLGIALDRQGRHQEAEEAYRRGLDGLERAYGPAHAHAATAHNNLGAALQSQDRLEEAEAEFRAAQQIWQAALGDAHPDLARAHTNIALVLEAQGKHAAGIEEHRRALEIAVRGLPADHPDIAIAQSFLGTALADARAYSEALPLLEDALGGLDHSEAAQIHTARASFALARALWTLDGDRSHALALAERARELRAAGNEGSAEAVREIERWLAAHTPR